MWFIMYFFVGLKDVGFFKLYYFFVCFMWVELRVIFWDLNVEVISGQEIGVWCCKISVMS